jgi:fructokinase
MMSEDYYGAIEAGGTKFVCAVGSGPGDIRSTARMDTTTPEETLDKVIAYFKEESQKYCIKGVGIGGFGPLDLNSNSRTYGYITSTPKPGWAFTDLVGTIKKALEIPVALDTDTNVAALSEGEWGAGRGLSDFIYLTVGTGIGGGAVVNGQLLHGLVHPEMGHVIVRHDLQRDPFEGVCPYHRDCLEGLACGPAIQKRWQTAPSNLLSDHPAWNLEADYLAQGIVDYICILSPKRVIIGGGVMKNHWLIDMIRLKVKEILNNYVKSSSICDHIDQYIVSPELGDLAGILGSIILAQK